MKKIIGLLIVLSLFAFYAWAGPPTAPYSLPSQSTATGKYLKSSGTVGGESWDSPAGAGNETQINRLVDADHANDNATGAGTRTDQSVTPKGLKSTIGVLFPGIDPSLTPETIVCVNSANKIGDCSNLTWDGNEMGLNGGILLGGRARIASGENYIVRIAETANSSGLKWYHFLTDSSNYQYGYLSNSATAVTLSADSNGTGADNIDVLLSPKGTGVIGNANKSFQVDSAGTATATAWATTRGAWGQRSEWYESNALGNDLFGIVANGNIATQRWFVPLAALTAGQVPSVDSVAGDNATLKGLSIIIPRGCTFDGGGSELADNATCYTNVPFKGVIKSWAIGAKSSSVLGGVVTFRAYKDTSANFPPTMPTDAICTTNSPRIAVNALHAESDNMTGWTTSVAAGDWIGFHVASDDNITWASVTLNIQMVP